MSKRSKPGASIHLVTIRATPELKKRMDTTFTLEAKKKPSQVYKEADHIRELLDRGLRTMESPTT